MHLSRLCASFAEYLHSDHFLQLARHAEFPRAFARERKLPLPARVASLVSGLCRSVQAELDELFGQLQQHAALVRHVSAQAFAQARAKLHADALPALNDHLLSLIEQAGGVPRWHGLRRVAVDAIHLRFGVRASHVPRAASRDALALGLYLPDAHLMLAAQLHSTCVGERQALFEQLHRLGTGGLVLLDRGYPCRWLIGLLQRQGIDFCMRVDASGDRGFALVQAFRKSDLAEQIVTLPRPDPQDVADFDCPPESATVRLIRHVCADGTSRILMTSLMDAERFPVALFADLYHERWSIEEAFKRLKDRLNVYTDALQHTDHIAVHDPTGALPRGRSSSGS